MLEDLNNDYFPSKILIYFLITFWDELINLRH